jgi:cytochrome c biogenesis protein CcmG/thiol:disulfide interchange protein DsbE
MLLRIAREHDVPIIGLDWKDDEAGAMRWLAELGNPYDAVAFDPEGRVAIDWGVYGAPETFLVGADGRVRFKQIGAMTPEVWQREFLPHLGATR